MKTDSLVSRRQVASALAGVGLFSVLGAGDRRAEARADTETATSTPSRPSQRPTVSIAGGRRVVDQPAYDDGIAPTDSPDYEPAKTRVAAAAWLEAVATEEVATAIHDELQTLASSHPNESPLRPVLAAVSDDEQLDGPVSLTIKQSESGAPTLLVDCPTGVDVEALNSLSAAEFTDRVVSAAQSELNTDKLTETIGGELSDEAVSAWIEQAYADLDVRFRQRPEEYDETGVRGLARRAADTRYRSEGIAMGSAVRSETRGATASAGFRGLRAGHAVLVTTAHTFYDRDEHPTALTTLLERHSIKPTSHTASVGVRHSNTVVGMSPTPPPSPSTPTPIPAGISLTTRPVATVKHQLSARQAGSSSKPIRPKDGRSTSRVRSPAVRKVGLTNSDSFRTATESSVSISTATEVTPGDRMLSKATRAGCSRACIKESSLRPGCELVFSSAQLQRRWISKSTEFAVQYDHSLRSLIRIVACSRHPRSGCFARAA